MNPQKITLDFWRNEYKTICVKQYDQNSRIINISCLSNGSTIKLEAYHMCNVKMITPDKRNIYNTATRNEDGTLTVVFTQAMLCASGTGKLEIEIIDTNAGTVISTMFLDVIIVGSVYPDDAVIASEEFNVFKEALLAMGELGTIEEIGMAVDTINNHATVVSNENTLGHVRVDGTTITIDENNVIHSISYGSISNNEIDKIFR